MPTNGLGRVFYFHVIFLQKVKNEMVFWKNMFIYCTRQKINIRNRLLFIITQKLYINTRCLTYVISRCITIPIIPMISISKLQKIQYCKYWMIYEYLVILIFTIHLPQTLCNVKRPNIVACDNYLVLLEPNQTIGQVYQHVPKSIHQDVLQYEGPKELYL